MIQKNDAATPPRPLISSARLAQLVQGIDFLFSLLLWATYFAAIIASFNHVAWAFNLLENPADSWNGRVAAAAVDGGLATIAYVVQQRRKGNKLKEKEAREGVALLIAGIVFLGIISMIANFLHGVSVELGVTSLTLAQIRTLDSIQWLRIGANAVTLPIIVIYLGEILEAPGAQGLVSQLLREMALLGAKVESFELELNQEKDKTKTLETTLTQIGGERDKAQETADRLVSERVRVAEQMTLLEAKVDEVEARLKQKATEVKRYEKSAEENKTLSERLNQREQKIEQMAQALGQKEEELAKLALQLESATEAKAVAEQATKESKHLFTSLSVETQEIANYIVAKKQGVPLTLEDARARALARTGQEMSKSRFQRLYTAVKAVPASRDSTNTDEPANH